MEEYTQTPKESLPRPRIKRAFPYVKFVRAFNVMTWWTYKQGALSAQTLDRDIY